MKTAKDLKVGDTVYYVSNGEIIQYTVRICVNMVSFIRINCEAFGNMNFKSKDTFKGNIFINEVMAIERAKEQLGDRIKTCETNITHQQNLIKELTDQMEDYSNRLKLHTQEDE